MRRKPALNRSVGEVVSIGELGYWGKDAQAGEKGERYANTLPGHLRERLPSYPVLSLI
jgi:hypothetical protein